jgi:hypothetical protein
MLRVFPQPLRFAASLSLLALCLPGGSASAAESALSAGVLASGDDQGYRWNHYQLEWGLEGDTAGLQATARWHQYSLDRRLAGVLPFAGAEPAVQLGGHLLQGLWWLSAAAGFQGTADLAGATGQLLIARAIPVGAGAVTPKLELARGAVAMTALPLSLGMASDRAQLLIAARGPGFTGEGGLRLERWEPGDRPGRVMNPAMTSIEETRIATVHGYLLTDGGWFNCGLAGKVARASRSTLVATETDPAWQYSWYPASAAPFAWESALVLRAQGNLAAALKAELQVQLPALSRETRQWDSLRRSYWGTAPYEGRLQATWSMLPLTSLQLSGSVFAKPWEGWDPFGPGAYRMASFQLSLRQAL